MQEGDCVNPDQYDFQFSTWMLWYPLVAFWISIFPLITRNLFNTPWEEHFGKVLQIGTQKVGFSVVLQQKLCIDIVSLQVQANFQNFWWKVWNFWIVLLKVLSWQASPHEWIMYWDHEIMLFFDFNFNQHLLKPSRYIQKLIVQDMKYFCEKMKRPCYLW